MAALINNYNDSHKDWEETSGELGYAGLDGEKLFLLDEGNWSMKDMGSAIRTKALKASFFPQWRGVPPFPSLADDMKTGIMRANASDNLKSDVTTWDVRDNAGVVYPAYNIRTASVSIQLIRKMMSRRIRTLR